VQQRLAAGKIHEFAPGLAGALKVLGDIGVVGVGLGAFLPYIAKFAVGVAAVCYIIMEQ